MSRTFPEGIVVLRFSENECYTRISNEPSDRLEVDLEARTWKSWRGRVLPFGEADVPPREYGRASMTICVYDVRDLKQLQSLLAVATSIEADGARGAVYMD